MERYNQNSAIEEGMGRKTVLAGEQDIDSGYCLNPNVAKADDTASAALFMQH